MNPLFLKMKGRGDQEIGLLEEKVRRLEKENQRLKKKFRDFEPGNGDTVSVPSKFKSIFNDAQHTVKKYFKQIKAIPSRGTIEVHDQRYILLRASALSYDFLHRIKALYADRGEKEAYIIGRNFLFDLAHVIGIEDARNFHRKMKLTKPIDKLSAGPVHFAYTGWAFVDILPESNPTPDENFLLKYNHPNSFEADSWIKNGKKADFPVCIMNAGYSSGWCEESFGVPLTAVEISCKAKGDKECTFIMAPPEKIEKHLKKEQKNEQQNELFDIPMFFKRKQMEEELLEHQNFLNSIIENIPAMLFLKDAKELKFVRFNKAGEDLLGIPREEMIGKNDYDFFPKEQADLFTADDKKVLKNKKLKNIEEEWIDTRKGRRMLHTRKIPIVDGSGKPLYLLGISEDITERKMAEEELKAALKEKELMISEIHHRVKNNLQVVSSLLSLQAQKTRNKKIQELFEDSQGRIKAMAIVHERLYKNDLYHQIDFKNYLISVVEMIQRSYRNENLKINFEIDNKIEELSIDIAVPCGLIVNEIVTNAYKHAFEPGSKGQIAIALLKMKNIYQLKIADNGKGFDPAQVEEDEGEMNSLGLQLIHTLIDQINGKVVRESKKGTSYTIQIPF